MRAKTTSILSILSGLLFCLAFQVSVYAQSHDAVEPVPRDSEYWQNRHNEINERITQGNVDLLFVGDSITHWWEQRTGRNGDVVAGGQAVWDEYYGPRNAANIGIAGDRTQHVLWRLDNGNIDGIAPRLSVVMIGTNNSRDNSAEEIADGIVAIIDKLKTELPSTKVLLLAIFPRGELPDERRTMLAHASELAAARAVDDERVFYLDIGDSFLTEDGALPAALMPDFLHPNEAGYRVWAEAMEPTLIRLFGE